MQTQSVQAHFTMSTLTLMILFLVDVVFGFQYVVHHVGEHGAHVAVGQIVEDCGSAWKRDPVSGVIGVEKGPLILVF
ncbi:hypothetical protein A7E77_02420 [Sphingomonas sp. NIC1]|nr:hypothetical protein A7E77_02420 [Sphingomonas sp. NIC1]